MNWDPTWEEFYEEWIKSTVLPQKSSKDKTKEQIQTNEYKENMQYQFNLVKVMTNKGLCRPAI